jgi:hypothetical protein
MKSTNRQEKKDPQHVPLYTPIFGEEAAIELPNDEMCINFGLEWLGRTCGARACSEKETAREKIDAALERKGSVRGVHNERVAEEMAMAGGNGHGGQAWRVGPQRNGSDPNSPPKQILMPTKHGVVDKF